MRICSSYVSHYIEYISTCTNMYTISSDEIPCVRCPKKGFIWTRMVNLHRMQVELFQNSVFGKYFSNVERLSTIKIPNKGRQVIRLGKKSLVKSTSSQLTRIVGNSCEETEKWLMVVESPAKAITISKYLGSMYKVMASYGHVRDLTAKTGSVDPENGFEMKWNVSESGELRLRTIKETLKNGMGLLLATDPDREGEAIAWHVVEVLQKENALPASSKVLRVCFHEITPAAVLEAVQHPRELSMPLVDAYLARRALDYLLGFAISPILWRKLPGCRSAGRVQSVALRLICERERERELFKDAEYWTVQATVEGVSRSSFPAELTHLNGARLEKHSLSSRDIAQAAEQQVRGAELAVKTLKQSVVSRAPSPPFTTSTLQQEASSKLGFGSVKTMSIAQKLYEGVGSHGGLITYMRTDSIQMASQAVIALRKAAMDKYGDSCVPSAPRLYKSKAVNAQEAHEAIRPTDPWKSPLRVKADLGKDEYSLYALIWCRSMASQMSSAEFHQVSVDIASSPDSAGSSVSLRASSSKLKSPGYLAVFQEAGLKATGPEDEEALGLSDSTAKDSSKFAILSSLQEGERIDAKKVESAQHFTEPPPRFTEGTMVKVLEELGVGRPSTYSGIFKTLQDRQYVRIERRRLVPEMRGRMVSSFLAAFFSQYVDSGFTAAMEARLDAISAGGIEWKQVLAQFWQPFHSHVTAAAHLDLNQVSDCLHTGLSSCLQLPESSACPQCSEEEGAPQGRLQLRVTAKGGHGLFLGCSNYPLCNFKVGFGPDGQQRASQAGPLSLGTDPVSGTTLLVKTGPYGPFLEASGPGDSPRLTRISIPASLDPGSLTVAAAMALVAADKGGPLGSHPADGEEVVLKKGPYGWYVSHGDVRAPLPKGMAEGEVTLDEAVRLLEKKALRALQGAGRGRGKPKGAVRSKEAGSKGSKEAGSKGSKEAGSKGSKEEVKEKPDRKEALLLLSPALSALLGGVERMSVSEATKAVWQYIKDQQLQVPEDRRRARLNRALQELLGVDEVTCLTLRHKLRPHLLPS